MPVLPPAKDKAAGETCLGALQGAPGAPWSQWHRPSGSIPRLAGNVGEGPFGRPCRSRGGGSHGASPWPGRSLQPVSYPCCRRAESLWRARLPSLLIHRTVPAWPDAPDTRLGLGPGLGWEWRPWESPSLRLVPQPCVCLSCPVPPHWSLVSTEVGGGPVCLCRPPSPVPPSPLGCV